LVRGAHQARESRRVVGLADPAVDARLDDLGGIPLSMSPEEFGKFLAGETEKMAKVIKAAGISVK